VIVPNDGATAHPDVGPWVLPGPEDLFAGEREFSLYSTGWVLARSSGRSSRGDKSIPTPRRHPPGSVVGAHPLLVPAPPEVMDGIGVVNRHTMKPPLIFDHELRAMFPGCDHAQTTSRIFHQVGDAGIAQTVHRGIRRESRFFDAKDSESGRRTPDVSLRIFRDAVDGDRR
jgi:hypothetical protein